MTDATDLLLNLKDIHEPIAPATSSALVLGLSILLSVLILCCVAGYWFWRRKAGIA